ncbi:hypothetical protein [Shewanella sp. Isolate11]|uniref:hypothetical protein n=1 Tax=Shewanella sp. Isolate11 TaxID=2908530 RepID=UPI001EFE8BEE|nr:hypothetical protein [Shewanella sp. Isolate11]MCG9697453.1 hypothetical protein [Shewanella sp. Isolate11]
MILSRSLNTELQRTEFRLLVAIRFACLMAKHRGYINPMDCHRVQTRCNDLQHHLAYFHPTREFERLYFHHAGELGQQFSLRYSEPKTGVIGTVTVWDNHAATNVYSLLNNNAATA